MALKIKLPLALLGAILFISCIKHKEADLIVHNGTIYTCDLEFTSHQAMAIKDGKVLEVGPEHQIRNKYTSAKFLDLKKKTVIPSFFDSHSYLFSKTLKAHTVAFDALNKIEASNHPKEQIVYIYNVPDTALAKLNVKDLQYVARTVSGNKVKIDAKSYALLFDSVGKTERIISSADSITTIINFLEQKQNSSFSTESMASVMFQNGITGCSSFGVSAQSAEKLLELKDSNFYHHIILKGSSENFRYLTKVGRQDSGLTRLKGLSYFIDGSFGDRDALLKTAYSNTLHHGKTFADSAVLYELPDLCASLNIQLIFHAYGDSAFSIAANSMAKALGTVNDRRWRIEHNQLVSEDDAIMLKNYSILPSVQPTQSIADKNAHKARLGDKRNCATYDFKALFDQNQILGSGSLYPIGALNPIAAFEALIAEGACDHPIDRKSALKALTIWPAMLAFFEDKTGSLEAGKNADFVVLNLDPMLSEPEVLRQATVLRTYFKGTEVFQLK